MIRGGESFTFIVYFFVLVSKLCAWFYTDFMNSLTVAIPFKNANKNTNRDHSTTSSEKGKKKERLALTTPTYSLRSFPWTCCGLIKLEPKQPISKLKRKKPSNQQRNAQDLIQVELCIGSLTLELGQIFP